MQPTYPNQAHHFNASDKLEAIALVYFSRYSISQSCDMYKISRTTWYRWERELKRAVQPVWGAFTRNESPEK